MSSVRGQSASRVKARLHREVLGLAVADDGEDGGHAVLVGLGHRPEGEGDGVCGEVRLLLLTAPVRQQGRLLLQDGLDLAGDGPDLVRDGGLEAHHGRVEVGILRLEIPQPVGEEPEAEDDGRAGQPRQHKGPAAASGRGCRFRRFGHGDGRDVAVRDLLDHRELLLGQLTAVRRGGLLLYS